MVWASWQSSRVVPRYLIFFCCLLLLYSTLSFTPSPFSSATLPNPGCCIRHHLIISETAIYINCLCVFLTKAKNKNENKKLKIISRNIKIFGCGAYFHLFLMRAGDEMRCVETDNEMLGNWSGRCKSQSFTTWNRFSALFPLASIKAWLLPTTWSLSPGTFFLCAPRNSSISLQKS